MYSFSNCINDIQYTSVDNETGTQIIPSPNIFRIGGKKWLNAKIIITPTGVKVLAHWKNLFVGSFYMLYYYPS